MNVYLRKVLGYTSETLLEFYRYLLTPPSLEELLENNRRGESLFAAANLENFGTGKRKRWGRHWGGRKRRRVARSLPPPMMNDDGWTITHDERNGIFCATRVDSDDDLDVMMQSSCEELLAPDADMSINDSEFDIASELSRTEAPPVDLNSSIDQIKRLELELNRLKESLTLLRPPPPPPAADEEDDEEEAPASLGPAPAVPGQLAGTPTFKLPKGTARIPPCRLDDSIVESPLASKAPAPPPPPMPAFSQIKKPNFVTTVKRSKGKAPMKPVTRGMSITDVLQNGLPKDILKPAPGVKRSPGGTPIKGQTSASGSENFLVEALKRKFHNAKFAGSPQSPTSPFQDKENSPARAALTPLKTSKAPLSENEWDSSPVSSPTRLV